MLSKLRFTSIGVSRWLPLAVAVACGGSTRGGDGGSGGASGSGGRAGMPTRCTLPAEPGNCNAYFRAYFHNPKTGVCEGFVYGGCGGNDNRFETREECQAACRGGTPDSADCELRDGAGRCGGGCDGVGLIAVQPEAFFDLLCTGIEMCVGCPPTLPPEPSEFVPVCSSGRCSVARVRR